MVYTFNRDFPALRPMELKDGYYTVDGYAKHINPLTFKGYKDDGLRCFGSTVPSVDEEGVQLNVLSQPLGAEEYDSVRDTYQIRVLSKPLYSSLRDYITRTFSFVQHEIHIANIDEHFTAVWIVGEPNDSSERGYGWTAFNNVVADIYSIIQSDKGVTVDDLFNVVLPSYGFVSINDESVDMLSDMYTDVFMDNCKSVCGENTRLNKLKAVSSIWKQVMDTFILENKTLCYLSSLSIIEEFC